MVATPGIYHGMTMEEYLKLEAVSQGDLRLLLDRCPRAGWFSSYLNPNRPPPDPTEDTDAGQIAHAILLEDSRSKVAVIDPNDYPAKNTGTIPEGWTNKGIQQARDQAREAGLLPVLKPRMAQIDVMVESAKSYIDSLRHTEPAVWAAFQPNGGDSELVMIWDDGGIPCRIRHDRIASNRKLIIDAKFTSSSAHPDSFGRNQLVRMGYYTAAAFYKRGVNVLCGETPEFVYLVVETDPPYLCSVVGLDPVAIDIGGEKIDQALKEWRRCVVSNIWASYPNRVAFPEFPTYEMNYWAERLGGEPGVPYDVSKLFRRES